MSKQLLRNHYNNTDPGLLESRYDEQPAPETGTQVKHLRSGDHAIIKKITTNKERYTTCAPNMASVTFEAGEVVTITIEFDDGELTIVDWSEIEILNQAA